MRTHELVSVHEYFSTSYRPDCDSVEGRVVERNVGELDHSTLHAVAGTAFFNREREFGIPYVWILDPKTHQAWRCTPGEMRQEAELRTENPAILEPLEEIFA